MSVKPVTEEKEIRILNRNGLKIPICKNLSGRRCLKISAGKF
jgi:hypothetical protein